VQFTILANALWSLTARRPKQPHGPTTASKGDKGRAHVFVDEILGSLARSHDMLIALANAFQPHSAPIYYGSAVPWWHVNLRVLHIDDEKSINTLIFTFRSGVRDMSPHSYVLT
jgi:hypothetical protein